jgi:hypothetical protein
MECLVDGGVPLEVSSAGGLLAGVSSWGDVHSGRRSVRSRTQWVTRSQRRERNMDPGCMILYHRISSEKDTI